MVHVIYDIKPRSYLYTLLEFPFDFWPIADKGARLRLFFSFIQFTTGVTIRYLTNNICMPGIARGMI